MFEIAGYDNWKLASPYDNEPETQATTCNECGRQAPAYECEDGETCGQHYPAITGQDAHTCDGKMIEDEPYTREDWLADEADRRYDERD